MLLPWMNASPSEPIINVGDAYFFLKTQNYKKMDWSTIRGVRMGLVDGYEYADSTLGDIKSFVPDYAQEYLTNFRKLQAGRVGMVLADKYVGLYTAKNIGLGNTVDFLQRPYQLDNPENNLYFAFLKTPRNEALALRFTEVQKQLKSSGEYQRLMQKYLP